MTQSGPAYLPHTDIVCSCRLAVAAAEHNLGDSSNRSRRVGTNSRATIMKKQSVRCATLSAAILFSVVGPLAAQGGDAVSFDVDGTTRIRDLAVPLPKTLSQQAADMIRARNSQADPTNGFTAPLAEIRKTLQPIQDAATATLLKKYPSKLEKKEIAGVPVTIVTPEKLSAGAEKKILINVHAGAFMLNPGLITEAIPIAALTGVQVVAVDYRLAPENPYPAAVDDTVAVYKGLLEKYSHDKIGIYGSSSGSILSAQAVLKARSLKLPLPAAVGFFSGTADFANAGDSEAIFGLRGFTKHITSPSEQAKGYIGKNNLKDPLLSPIYADLRDFPPTLAMTGTRDFFLSGTSNFHRALLKADVKAELVVFDALPHIHWEDPSLPESEEAWRLQAQFLAGHLSD